MKILVADDEPTSRRILEMSLRNLGHECHTAADGQEAWACFQTCRPEVVISDWLMPRLTGLELCRDIRAEGSDLYTYVILLTGQGAVEAVIEGMNAGADDYLIKPLNLDDLHGRLIAAERVTSLHRQLGSQRVELEDLNERLKDIARRDPLTGLGNRRALEEDLELMEARVERYGHRYCMALLDVDHFKSYNDTYGHPAGDDVLKIIASQLKRQARGGDALYRYGGEEFLCIFPEQSLATGVLAVERMRTSIEELALPHTGNPPGVVTISAGLAILDPSDARSAAEVLKEADIALYRAKQGGRNRVEQGCLPAHPPV